MRYYKTISKNTLKKKTILKNMRVSKLFSDL